MYNIRLLPFFSSKAKANKQTNKYPKLTNTHSFIVCKAVLSCFVCLLSCFSRVQLFATVWTVACQALLSMGSSRWEYWSGLPCLPPGPLSNLGIKRACLMSPLFPYFLPLWDLVLTDHQPLGDTAPDSSYENPFQLQAFSPPLFSMLHIKQLTPINIKFVTFYLDSW